MPVGREELRTGVRVLEEDPDIDLADFFLDASIPAALKRFVVPRNLNQRRFMRAVVQHDYVFSTGPAGTGKTYLAVAMAAAYLLDKQVRRIVVTRPAVEAGERLGFLPGDLAEKINPYLRPIHDALYDILGYDKVSKLMERQMIEIAPLAFMRGRTLNDAFIILDEAQNTTREQMKMFLTRMGFNSKVVITGDVTQIDLPKAAKSGLVEAERILKGIEGIAFVYFSEADVVRHPLVARIVRAYEEAQAKGG
jgi:phosphate starvation-inducible PhoH-like protein